MSEPRDVKLHACFGEKSDDFIGFLDRELIREIVRAGLPWRPITLKHDECPGSGLNGYDVGVGKGAWRCTCVCHAEKECLFCGRFEGLTDSHISTEWHKFMVFCYQQLGEPLTPMGRSMMRVVFDIRKREEADG